MWEFYVGGIVAAVRVIKSIVGSSLMWFCPSFVGATSQVLSAQWPRQSYSCPRELTCTDQGVS